MLEKYSNKDVINIVNQLVAEAIIEGRLDNVEPTELEEAKQLGLSLGFATEEGLELGLRSAHSVQANRMGKAFMDGTTLGGGTPSSTRIKRRLAQSKMYTSAFDKSPQGKLKGVGRGIKNIVKQNPRVAKLVGVGGAIGAGIGIHASLTRKKS